MAHDEYLQTEAEATQQNVRNFNWDLRSTVYLQPVVIVDGRLDRCFDAIKKQVGVICAEHDAPVQKVEVVIGSWQVDQNFGTVIFRWTSNKGVFLKEFGARAVTTTDGSRVYLGRVFDSVR